MTFGSTACSGRKHSLFFLFGVAAVATLFAAGCTTQSVRPVPYDSANTAKWFAGPGSRDIDDSYKADYEETRESYQQGNYTDAVNEYGQLAEEGAPEAAYELGKAYRYGNGVPLNAEKAAEWLIAAVSQPNSRRPHASYHLGSMFLEGEGVPQDLELGRRLLEQAYENGYARAALPLARLYAEGRGVDQDVSRAIRLAMSSAESGDLESYLWLLRGLSPGGTLGGDRLRAAALADKATALLRKRIDERNDPRAMRDLAIIYYQGLGVPEDRGEAMRWLERAAQLQHPEYLANFGEDVMKGNNGLAADPREGFRILLTTADRYWSPEAMAMLAEAYRDGLGTQPDPVAAENWFKRAVEAGSPQARLEYGRMLVARREKPEDVQRGVTYLEAAAGPETPYAWAELGELYIDEDFPGADPAKGAEYLQKAHEAGIASATAHLGEAYLEGRGVPRDPAKAEPLLTQAAEAGQPGAMMDLGQAYLDGDGLPRDPNRAKQWLEKADAAGVDSARFMLGRALLSGEIPGDAAKGLRIVASFAQSGDTLAMMDMGRAMRDGKTVPRDLTAARRWFENAMKAGDPDAEDALASMLYDEADDGGLRFGKLQEAAELGHAGAMSRLGRAYLQGEGLAPNPVQGRIWLERAVEAGNFSAAQTLGSAYLTGEHGLERDPGAARRLLEMAVTAGDRSAERDLGYALVEPGDAGFPPNPERGLRLLTLAARKGDTYAMELLGRVYLEGGDGVMPNPENAKVWLELAADHGDVSSMTVLGSAYIDKVLPGSDPQTGVAYLERAAAQGDDAARSELGSAYLFGTEEIAVQRSKGEQLLKAAAGNGHAGAMAELGRAYLDGTLGERRIDEGARMLFEAARAGHPTARYVLAEAFLQSQGLESANRDYAQAWLNTVVAGDTDTAVATLTEMLREAKVDMSAPPLQKGEGEAVRP